MKYCDRNDAIIRVDDREGSKGGSLLYDCDGEMLFAFPEGWTDEQVLRALDFANLAYERGEKAGQTNKSYEIRRALGILL